MIECVIEDKLVFERIPRIKAGLFVSLIKVSIEGLAKCFLSKTLL